MDDRPARTARTYRRVSRRRFLHESKEPKVQHRTYHERQSKATLVRELGHRLAFALPWRGDLDDHRLLYLFLHGVWTDLYGRDFADRMAGIERRIGPAYEEAWTWALAMTREQRQARLAALRAGKQQGSERVSPSSRLLSG